MAFSHSRPRILIANRGEIAHRIISACNELSLTPIALHTSSDFTHATNAAESIELSGPEGYMNPELIVRLCKEHGIGAIHPGYGFLSESAELARLAQEQGVAVVGPGEQVLRMTGDKLAARKLAERCGVPVLPALADPTRDVGVVRSFAARYGYPVMIKAVDGGGGRGIRLVRGQAELESAFRRAVEESPSKSVYAEKAAVDGVLHVEIQVVGDGNNAVGIGERQCSIQRRWQKVVEIGPCVKVDRKLVGRVVNAAVGMARDIKYSSLGTFEFLVQPATQQFYFLEINPRLQVEHTVTEVVTDIDLVRAQLLIAQGANLEQAGVNINTIPSILSEPHRYACQLRLTAEDVSKDWSLSVGTITSLSLPTGNGVRVDHSLAPGYTVGSSFDSLLAKIIVSGKTWPEVVCKAQRALNDTAIEGVKTNLDALRGITAHPDFAAGDCDTRWLETKQPEIMALSTRPIPKAKLPELSSAGASAGAGGPVASGPLLFRSGDAWSVVLEPKGSDGASSTNHISVTSVVQNNFPASLVSEIEFTNASGETKEYKLTLNSTSSSASAITSQHRRGDINNPRHIVIPIPGKLVEVMVDEGDIVKADDVICVVQQMKMEIEIRAKTSGKVVWITDAEDGEEISEGLLAAEIEPLEAKL